MRPSLERLGAFLPAAVAIALPTTFIPTAVDSFIIPRAAIVVAGACIGAGIALLIPGGPGLGSLRWPLLAAAAAAILAFLFSVSPALSLAGSYTRYESLPVRLGYLGLFAMTVWLARSEKSRHYVAAAFVFGTSVACLEALYQWFAQLPFRPDGNLGNANLLGALVAMAAPIAVAYGFRGGRFALAWWAALVVLGAGILVTTSRSGGVGVLAGCAAVAVFTSRGRARVAVTAIGATVTAALIAIQVSPLRLLNDDPGPARLHLWHDGLTMIASRPLTGWGLDTTGLAFGQFLSGDWSPGVTFDRLHSGPLDIAATQGLLGLAALGWVLVVIVRCAWRQRAATGVSPMFAACVGYSVWVVFNFDWAPATGAFWLLAGTAWGAVRAAETAPRANREPDTRLSAPTWWRSGLAVALGVAAVLLAAMPVLADVWYSQNRSDLSVRVDPLQARYHWSLGQGLIARGQPASGVDEMLRAAALGETEPSLYVELGDAQLQVGRRSAARDAYRRALTIDPYYAPAIKRLATVVS
jgi:O-antigen ligase